MACSGPDLRTLAFNALPNQVPSLSELTGSIVLNNKNKLAVAAQQPLYSLWVKFKCSLKAFGFDQAMQRVESDIVRAIRARSIQKQGDLEILQSYPDILFKRFAKTLHEGRCVSFELNTTPTDLVFFARIHQELENNGLRNIWAILSDPCNRPFQLPVCRTVNQIRACFENLGYAMNFCRISKLDLSGLGLMVIPSQISKCAHLEELNFTNNKIFSVPEWLGNLKELKTLALMGNSISFIPESLGNLKKLKWFSASNNYITNIPGWLGKDTSLKVLCLTNNLIHNIPESTLSNLDKKDICVSISHNPLLYLFYDGIYGKASEIRRKSNQFKKYQCLSSFSKLCQFIEAGNDQATVAEFNLLKKEDKNLIFEMVYEEAGFKESLAVAKDPIWGENHVFDDRTVFIQALRRAVFEKFNRLNVNQRNAVYGNVYELAGRPKTNDLKWGERHVFDEVLRLIDAMDKVTE